MSTQDPLNRYSKVKQIGKGSYGSAYLMRDKVSNEFVVVKTIEIKESDANSKKVAQKEARVLNMLRHPNVILYIDSFYSKKGEFCIVTEYADGKDLQKFIESHGEIDEKKVLQIFTQLILGLDYMHSQNILHRDIKTANVFLFKKGLVKLGDFGISRELLGDDLAQTLIGTPYFMCPELLRGQRYGFPADIWAAGCVLFELLARKHAFTGKSREELFANIKSGQMPQMPSNYSKGLLDLLRSMLSQDPSKRPSCKDILASDIIGKGLDELQSKLLKQFGGISRPPSSQKTKLPQRPTSSAKNTTPDKTKLAPKGGNTKDSSDEEEVGQSTMPEWLGGDQQVCDELVRQSMRRINNDANWLLGVIRSSISMKQKNSPSEISSSAPITFTGKLSQRKERLENEAKKLLGDKYDSAYMFIKDNGQDKREELLSMISGGQPLDRELKMIEIITAIEELS